MIEKKDKLENMKEWSYLIEFNFNEKQQQFVGTKKILEENFWCE
jgi:hypothetical protein